MKTSAFTGTPSIASLFPIAIDIPVSVPVAVADEPEPPTVENNYDSATTPCRFVWSFMHIRTEISL